MSMKKSVEIDKARSYQYLCTIDKMGDDKIKQMCDVGEGRRILKLANRC